MKSKIKTVDFLMASVIFVVTLIEFISWRICVNENYLGEVKGSDYLLSIYPMANTLVIFIFASYFIFKTFRYKLCIYTILVTWIYFLIQLFNILALSLKFGMRFYSEVIYPSFLFSIFGLILIKIIRWVSFKRF